MSEKWMFVHAFIWLGIASINVWRCFRISKRVDKLAEKIKRYGEK